MTLTGKSNRDYVFTVLSLNRKLPHSAGVYVITNTVFDDGEVLHHPLSIGSCRDLSKLFDETKIEELRNDGMNRVCVKIEEITENRHQIENDLKGKYLS